MKIHLYDLKNCLDNSLIELNHGFIVKLTKENLYWSILLYGIENKVDDPTKKMIASIQRKIKSANKQP